MWVTLPLGFLIARGSIQDSLLIFVLVPVIVFMLLWFIGVFGSWIVTAFEVKNPILRVFAVIGVLLIIGLMIAVGISSKGGGSDDYEQYDRGDPTYFRK